MNEVDLTGRGTVYGATAAIIFRHYHTKSPYQFVAYLSPFYISRFLSYSLSSAEKNELVVTSALYL